MNRLVCHYVSIKSPLIYQLQPSLIATVRWKLEAFHLCSTISKAFLAVAPLTQQLDPSGTGPSVHTMTPF